MIGAHGSNIKYHKIESRMTFATKKTVAYSANTCAFQDQALSSSSSPSLFSGNFSSFDSILLRTVLTEQQLMCNNKLFFSSK